MTTHIQIPDTLPIIHYTANGTQREFTYPFPIFKADQLHILEDNIPVTSGFTVLNVGKTQGGSVMFDTAPATGKTITLKRQISIQRMTDFIEGGELSSHALNNEFDQLTAIIQEVDYDKQTALRYPENEQLSVKTIPAKNIRANKVLGFDSNGQPTVFETGGEGGGPSAPSTYTQDGTGAILRQLEDKAKETVSVKDFGAIGDGVHDDSDAFTLALAAHRHVTIPSGNYLISRTIEITSDQTLQGYGASSVLIAHTNDFDVLDVTGSHNHLSDFVIQGGETGIRLYGKTQACSDNIIQNITLLSQNIAIELDGYISTDAPCMRNSLYNITIQDPQHYGVLITRSGGGHPPECNHFLNIRVVSNTTPLEGAAFSIEAARKNTLFSQCSVIIHGTAQAMFLIGGQSIATHIHDFYGQTSSTILGVLLTNGSLDTVLKNLRIQSSSAVFQDLSLGNYIAHNITTNSDDYIPQAEIKKLTVHQKYSRIVHVSPPGPLSVPADLKNSTYMLDANKGQINFQLPKASESNKGAVLHLTKTDTTNNAVMVQELTGTGPNGRGFRLGSMHDRISITSDGTMWRIIDTNIELVSSQFVNAQSIYYIDVSKRVHIINSTSGITLVELPPASHDLAVGRILTIKKIDASSNAVRITEAGGAGPDNAVLNLTTAYASVTLISNGMSWFVIGKS